MKEENTIKELLDYIKNLEEQAGQCCMNSEGTQGCDEANEYVDLHSRILKLIKK